MHNSHPTTSSTAKRGFTLIELLVVIAIIAILAAILFPVFAAAREKARQTTCASNLKQIGLAVLQYCQDYDEFFPLENDLKGVPVAGMFECAGSNTTNGLYYSWPDRVYPYIQSQGVFLCPDGASATLEGGGQPPSKYCQYGLNVFLSQYANGNTALGGTVGVFNTYPMSKIQRPDSIIMASDYSGHGGTQVGQEGVNLSYGNNGVATGDSIDYVVMPAFVTSGYACAINPAQRCFEDPVSNRHNTGANYAFCDGHVKFMQLNVDAAGYKHGALYDAMYDAAPSTNDIKEGWALAADAAAKNYWDPIQ